MAKPRLLQDRHEIGTFQFEIHVLECRVDTAAAGKTDSGASSEGTESKQTVKHDEELRNILLQRHDALNQRIRESVEEHIGDTVAVSDVQVREGSVKLLFVLFLIANYADVKDGIENIIDDIKHFIRSCASNTSVTAAFQKGGLEEYLRVRREVAQRFQRDMLFLGAILVIALLYWFDV